MNLQLSKDWFEKHISDDDEFEVSVRNPRHLMNGTCGEHRPPLKKRVWRYRVRVGKIRIDLSRIETSRG